jgi:hypothetical protein
VKGAPANPMSGVFPSSSLRISRIASSTYPRPSSGSNTRSFSIAARSRTGEWMTGPSPFANSNGAPIGSSGSRMSANKIAASIPRRSGWSVTSIASSGVLHSSSSVYFCRSARYSAM